MSYLLFVIVAHFLFYITTILILVFCILLKLYVAELSFDVSSLLIAYLSCSHTRPGSLRICIYEGVREVSLLNSSAMDINELVSADIVLTTYDVLRDDLSHDSERHEGDRRLMRYGKRFLSSNNFSVSLPSYICCELMVLLIVFIMILIFKEHGKSCVHLIFSIPCFGGSLVTRAQGSEKTFYFRALLLSIPFNIFFFCQSWICAPFPVSSSLQMFEKSR